MTSGSTELRSIEYDNKVIEYVLTRKKVKNINLRINGNGIVKVSANRYVPVRVIEKFIVEHASFITRAKEKAGQKAKETETAFMFENGDVFMLSGNKVRLEIHDAPYNNIRLCNNTLYLSCTNSEDRELVRKIYLEWLGKYTKETLLSVCEKIYPFFKPMGVQYPQIKFRKMKSRWGSCNYVKGIITLNTTLAAYQVEAVEYVVMHEFAHFIVQNHSKDFYAVVERFMPDWKRRKGMLS